MTWLQKNHTKKCKHRANTEDKKVFMGKAKRQKYATRTKEPRIEAQHSKQRLNCDGEILHISRQNMKLVHLYRRTSWLAHTQHGWALGEVYNIFIM